MLKINIIHKLLRGMLFLPSVTFNIFKSEIFPWAVIWLLCTRIRFKLADILILSMLMFWLLAGLFSYQSGSALTTAASYLNPILAFILVLNCSDELIGKVFATLKFIFPIFCITAVFQTLGLLTLFDVIFDFAVPRGGVGDVGGSRGVSIFSTEPSRAAVELIFMYGALISLACSYKGIKLGSVTSDLFMGLLVLGIIKSATGLLFFFILMAIRRPVLLWPILVCIFALLSYLVIETRASGLFFEIIESGSFIDAVSVLVTQSGFRILSVVSSYIYGLHNFVGAGIGGWEYLAVDSYYLAGFQPSDVSFFRTHYEGQFVALKPTAYGAIIALELGFISVILFTFYLQKRLRLFSLGYEKHEFAVIMIFLLYVFFLGAIGNPVPWVCAALAVRAAERRLC